MVRFEIRMDTQHRLRELERRCLPARGQAIEQQHAPGRSGAAGRRVAPFGDVLGTRAGGERVRGLERGEPPGRRRRLFEVQLNELARV